MATNKTTAGASDASSAEDAKKAADVEQPGPVPGEDQAAQASDQPVSKADDGDVHPSRQMVPPDTESKQEGKFPGDPNWYPDPEDPPKSY